MTILEDTYSGRASPTRSTSRPSVTYETYVLTYSRQQARNALVIFAGIALIVGAIMRLDGWPVVVAAAVGLGLAASGATGLLIAAAAHADYSQRLGITTATTYATPEPAKTVRPFVASRNGTTIRRGRFSLEAGQWAKLFDAAKRNDGRLTRDGVVAARLPRLLYGDGAWGETLAELGRVGIVDAAGVVTDSGWEFYRAEIAPLPRDNASPVRSDIDRPTGDRPGDRGS